MDLQNIQIKEWTTHVDTGNTGSPDYIVVVTKPMYTSYNCYICKEQQMLQWLNHKEGSDKMNIGGGGGVSSKMGEDSDLEDMDLALYNNIETDLNSTVYFKETANKPSKFTGHQ